MSKSLNEATRVQMPAMLHLTRLGYTYFGKIHIGDKTVYDQDTNILLDVFKNQFEKLNPGTNKKWQDVLADIRKELDDDDLGRQFYNRLLAVSPERLVDFENPANNVFHFTSEFTCKNGEDEFRPDITLFVNGLPLCFIEVKKPNNPGGMLDESKRMNEKRFPNKKFRRFINITQLMIFSNNMEYDSKGGIVPIEGVFYCTAGKKYAPFNCFREENPARLPIAPYNKNYPYRTVDDDVERQILTDFNVPMLKENEEYITNKKEFTPTNRVLTSLCSPERLLFMIKYGLAYLHFEKQREDGTIESRDEKHIMRYQQFFASQIIREKLNQGVKSGIVWHTQGSGKTALTFYLHRVLTDLFAKQNKVAKFYFIVDRLDLLEQASQEFAARGLNVTTANSKQELIEQFRQNQSQEGTSGKAEITVVNIQKFAEDKETVKLPDYATNLQRVFVMDEAHRGYKPSGCFLANLFGADPNAIKIALTGTPLIGEERSSCAVFGDYLHTYYYDRSVQDGYTLKILREDIETSYRDNISKQVEHLETLVTRGEISKNDIIEHPTYVKALMRYILTDLRQFRGIYGDDTLGGMIICETSGQAKKMMELMDEVQDELIEEKLLKKKMVAGLILHDSEDKETRKKIINDFKKNMTVDLLIVFNMLLTGFDAPRLKRLYFGRKVKDHNLLQAITRVNRPYKDMKYGFLIDFADIKQNFDETNAAYLRELNRYNIDQLPKTDNGEGENNLNLPTLYQQVMEDKESLIKQMKEVRQVLFEYPTNNIEEFTTEISSQEDKCVLIDLKHALELARDTVNIVRNFGDDELKAEIDKIAIAKVPEMLTEVQRRINLINQKEAFQTSDETKFAINRAMMDIEFSFNNIGEEELRIIDGGAELREKYQRAIQEMTDAFDKDDPEYISIVEAFQEIFKEHGFQPSDLAHYNAENVAMGEILNRLNKLKKTNEALLKRYNGDSKFAYVHKRIREENARRSEKKEAPIISKYDDDIVQALCYIKNAVDEKVFDRNDILRQDAFFSQTVLQQIAVSLQNIKDIKPSMVDYDFIKIRVAKQYIDQYNNLYGA